MTIAATGTSAECTGLEYTKKYVKQMLKNSMFIGSFQEKRFVEELNAYRDIITISPDEEDFIKNLQSVKRKLDMEILTKPWIGITFPETIGAPVGYNLWVVLPQEVFGKYWYRVKTIEFMQNEIRLKLDIVRRYQREATPTRISDEIDESMAMIIQEKKLQLKENVIYFFRHLLTWQNIRDTIIFVSVLISAMLAGLLSMVEYLLDYLLKLIREISGLLKASTPIIVNLFNLVGRCIFGLYQLIFTLLQGKPKPPTVYNNYISFDPQSSFSDPRARYNKYFNNRALPYPTHRTGGPTITPLDN